MASPGTNSRAGRIDPLPVAFDASLDCQRRFQGIDGIACLALFPESHDGVGEQQDENDPEIGPVPGSRREDHRRVDHPRDRPPKNRTGISGRRLVFLTPISLGPYCVSRFCASAWVSSARRRSQLFFDLGQREGFEVVLRSRVLFASWQRRTLLLSPWLRAWGSAILMLPALASCFHGCSFFCDTLAFVAGK